MFFLKGSTWYYLLNLRSPFHAFFCIGFQTCFSPRSEPEKAQNGNPKQQQIKTICKKIIIETHPQPRASKKLRPGGVKHLKLTTFTTLPKSRFRAPKTDKNWKKQKTSAPPRKQRSCRSQLFFKQRICAGVGISILRPPGNGKAEKVVMTTFGRLVVICVRKLQ